MAAEKSQNVQDVFLNHIRKHKVPVTVPEPDPPVAGLGEGHQRRDGDDDQGWVVLPLHGLQYLDAILTVGTSISCEFRRRRVD